MAYRFSDAISHRFEAPAGALGITKGALLLWARQTTVQVGRYAALTDPVAAVDRVTASIITTGTVQRLTADLATTDIDVQALFTNFARYANDKWCCHAFLWSTPTEEGGGAGDQQLLIGDEDPTAGQYAAPSAYSTQSAGSGAMNSADATSFWKIANRRQNDTNFRGRIAYAMLVDRSGGTQVSTAELEAWRRWPGMMPGGKWLYEFLSATGQAARDLSGNGLHGTFTGAVDDAHMSMKPFSRRSMLATRGGMGLLGPVIGWTSRQFVAFPATLAPINLQQSTLVLTGSIASTTATALAGTLAFGGPITLAGARAQANATGLVGTLSLGAGVVLAGQRASVTATALAGTLSLGGSITLAGTRAQANATALAGTLSLSGPITLAGQRAQANATGLVGVLSIGGSGTPSITNWVVPIRLTRPVLSPGNAISARVGLISGRLVTSGAPAAFPGAAVTAWLARAASPSAPLSGITVSVTLTGARGTLRISRGDVDTILAALSPAPVELEKFLVVVDAPGDFRRQRSVYYQALP